MSDAPVELVRPDAVINDATGEETDVHPLNPCPNCGAVPHDQPELFGRVGLTVKDALEWTKQHCWKCGYVPAQTVEETRRQGLMWEAFQRWYNERPELHHPTVNAEIFSKPPQSQTVVQEGSN